MGQSQSRKYPPLFVVFVDGEIKISYPMTTIDDDDDGSSRKDIFPGPQRKKKWK